MDIKVNHIYRNLQYFTLTDNSGNSYEWHDVEGKELDADDILLQIRKTEYPSADFGETLADMEQWIKDGYTNPEITEEYEEEISPARYAVKDSDTPQIDKRIKGIKREDDRRKVIPELLEPAVVETKTRIVRPKKVISKMPWVSTHPKSLELIEQVDKVKTIADIKIILKKMI